MIVGQQTKPDTGFQKRDILFSRLKTAAIVGLVWAGSAVNGFSNPPESINQLGRLFGFGWSDGYHSCRDNGCRPGADLPPRSYSDQFSPRKSFDSCGPVYPPGTGLPPIRPAHRTVARGYHAPCDSPVCDSPGSDTSHDGGHSLLAAPVPQTLPAQRPQVQNRQPVSTPPDDTTPREVPSEGVPPEPVVSESVMSEPLNWELVPEKLPEGDGQNIDMSQPNRPSADRPSAEELPAPNSYRMQDDLDAFFQPSDRDRTMIGRSLPGNSLTRNSVLPRNSVRGQAIYKGDAQANRGAAAAGIPSIKTNPFVQNASPPHTTARREPAVTVQVPARPTRIANRPEPPSKSKPWNPVRQPR